MTPELSEPTTVSLLRAFQRQFAGISELATGKALHLPDTSFSHYRKMGEAAGLHTAWRMVADLAKVKRAALLFRLPKLCKTRGTSDTAWAFTRRGAPVR